MLLNWSKQLKVQVDSLNELNLWCNWDGSNVTIDKLNDLIDKIACLNIDLSHHLPLRMSLFRLGQRIEREAYLGASAKELAQKVRGLVGDNLLPFDIIRRIFNVPPDINFLSDRSSKDIILFSKVSKQCHKILEDVIQLRHDAFPIGLKWCPNANDAIENIIKRNLAVANLKNYSDLTDDHLEKLFKKAPRLQHLMIQSKLVTRLPAECRRLQTLQVAGCINLRDLPEGMDKLTELDCSGCNLEKLPSGMLLLEMLNCSTCDRLIAIPLDICRLKILRMNHCPIVNLSSNHLEMLEELYCYNGKGITSLPDGMRNLWILGAIHCSLSVLPKGMDGLREIHHNFLTLADLPEKSEPNQSVRQGESKGSICNIQ